MILMDVNILVYAFRRDAADHDRYRNWLLDNINSDAAFGSCDLVSSGFLRIVTHPKVFKKPSSLEDAGTFIETIRRRPNCCRINFGERHWRIFSELCEKTNAKGNLVPDAYLAALAIESGCEWISTDRDYARFPGLNWRHPFD